MSELTLPAGSMQSALLALREGADAVSLSLKNVSLHKRARNFTFEEYSKLWQYAQSSGKKVYIAMDPIIVDLQLEKAHEALHHLAIIGCDGIIVQDLGLARLIHTQYQNIPLHGSERLSIHSVEGVKELERLGFSRVTLAKELTFDEIQHIRKTCPEMALSLIIHGSLDYSFSALAMTMGQEFQDGLRTPLCRTSFNDGKENGYFFSMKDVELGEDIQLLQNIGIDSFMIEGQTKSTAYVANVAKAYKQVLQGEDARETFKRLHTIFSRALYGGWTTEYRLNGQRKSPLCATDFPSHKGIIAATLKDVEIVEEEEDTACYAQLEVQEDISLYDGFMYLSKRGDEAFEAQRVSLISIDGPNDNPLKKAKKGSCVSVHFLINECPPLEGDLLYLYSVHDQNEKIINTDRMPITKLPLAIQVTVERDSMTVETDKKAPLSASYKAPITVDTAQSNFDWKAKLASVLSKSDISPVVCNQCTIVDHSNIADSKLFIPVSQLKAVRRAWYAILDQRYAELLESDMHREISEKTTVETLPLRSHLMRERLPFFTEIPKESESLIKIDNLLYLPLSPLCLEEEKEKTDLIALLHTLEAENLLKDTRIGINALAQIGWLREGGMDVKAFADIYLSIANAEAAQSIQEQIPHFCGAYLYQGTVNQHTENWPFKPATMDPLFKPPLFISRSCFTYDSLHLPDDGSLKHAEYHLTQEERAFTVLVTNDISYVLAETETE